MPTTTLVEPPAPLLPQQVQKMSLGQSVTGNGAELTADRFGSGCELALQPSASPLAGTPPCLQILHEDGLARFAVADYQGSGATRLVRALQFSDATGAFSAFTFYRSTYAEPRDVEMDFKAGRAVASSGGRNTLIWAGSTILSVDTPLTRPEIEQWLAILPKVGGRRVKCQRHRTLARLM